MWNHCWIMLHPVVRLDHQHPFSPFVGSCPLNHYFGNFANIQISTTQKHRLLHPSIHLSLSKIDTRLVFVSLSPKNTNLVWLISFIRDYSRKRISQKKKVLNILERYHPRKVGNVILYKERKQGRVLNKLFP